MTVIYTVDVPDNSGSVYVFGFNDDDSSGATGNDFKTTFTEGGSAVSIADLQVTTVEGSDITDVDSANMVTATITLTNAKAGDSLTIDGTLPTGITCGLNASVPT